MREYHYSEGEPGGVSAFWGRYFAILMLFALVACRPVTAWAADSNPAGNSGAPAGDAGTQDAVCPGDSDCDGVPDDVEIRIGTDPHKCDTDGDGFSDGVELGYIQPKVINGCHGLTAAGTNYRYPHRMDPLNPDSDGDGLCDGPGSDEIKGKCVGGEDKNGNGWVDADETDPSDPDTDGDGLDDYVETTGDFDHDGLPDFDYRLVNNGPKCNPPKGMDDLDCDAIPNAGDLDSDNDGCPDKDEGGWLDKNNNGIPDVYDAAAKSCPEPASASSSSSTGGATSGSKKDGDTQSGDSGQSLFSPDGTDGGACVLIRGQGVQAETPVGLAEIIFGFFAALLGFLAAARFARFRSL
ncbi:MAG: hypothetical protein V2A66_04570 [Pseudomonadota bacterium]